MKRLFLFLFVAVLSIAAMSQATSLVVDNQTPGWLSSKINYGDQQTLINLTVTGYINQADVDFINQLISEHNLHGRLDLSDVEIIGNTKSDDNKMTGYYNGEKCSIKGVLSHLLLPYKLQSATRACCHAFCDTITLGGSMNHIEFSSFFYGENRNFSSSYKSIKHLIFREGVDSVGHNRTTYSGEKFDLPNLVSIHFPSTLKRICNRAFTSCSNLQNVNLPDSIEEIGYKAFYQVPAFKDTLFLPLNLKTYTVCSFVTMPPDNGYSYYNLHVYIPQNVSTIDFSSVDEVNDALNFHIDNPTPVSIKNITDKNAKNVNVYLPKNLIMSYSNDENWSKFNLIAEPNPATGLDIDRDTVVLKKSFTDQLVANITPADADSIDVKWRSVNTQIATVTNDGIITGVSTGRTYIYATLASNPNLKDSCLVVVSQPVTELKIDNDVSEIKVGERLKLKADIQPADADNKNVTWQSNQPSIASINEKGEVTTLKSGVVTIYAISQQNQNIKDSCEITILQPVTGITLDEATHTLGNIGESFQLTATISPADASDKEVKWRSTSESVCIVSAGKVVAVGEGTTVIVAVTNDGSYMATCTVTVDTSVGIHDATTSGETVDYKIYDVDGKELSKLKRGINIIKFQNGETKKVLIP